MPPTWEVRHSNSKNLPYYFCPDTKESRWEPPAGSDPDKLKLFMAKFHSTKTNGSDAAQTRPGKIRCAHILVKHEASRRPMSWRQDRITRTKDQALDKIQGHEATIRGGHSSLSELALTESDCNSARKKGDLYVPPGLRPLADARSGFFGKGDMQKEFEDAAFTLEPGDMSGVVETASGYHLIQRCVPNGRASTGC